MSCDPNGDGWGPCFCARCQAEEDKRELERENEKLRRENERLRKGYRP